LTDTIVIKSAPTNEAPEGHDQKMIDLVDKNAEIQTEVYDTPEVPEDRPTWLPEKFKTAEDMAKAYGELETKIGKPPVSQEVKPEATPDDAKEALASKGLDLSEFSQEFSNKGELSTDSYDRLDKAGYDRNLVDQFIEGQKARASQFETNLKSEIGGDDKYSELMQWAKGSLNTSEVDAYNTAVNSGNIDQAKLAVLGLSARYSKENGSDPQRMVGGAKGAGGEDLFESTAQLTVAMRDPRYKTDPAYRNKVQSKLARSNVF
jgi:hypothetical protein